MFGRPAPCRRRTGESIYSQAAPYACRPSRIATDACTVIHQPQAERSIRDDGCINRGVGDATPNAIRIFNPNSHIVLSRVETLSRSCGHALGMHGSRRRRSPSQTQSQDALDAGALHPSGRAGVPGPAAASDMRRRRIDIGGDDVGLDLVAVDIGPRAGVVDRIEQARTAPPPCRPRRGSRTP